MSSNNSAQEKIQPVFRLHGERAKIINEAMNEGKHVVMVPGTVEGRTVIEFYVDPPEVDNYYLIDFNTSTQRHSIETMRTSRERAVSYALEKQNQVEHEYGRQIVLAKEVTNSG